MMFRGLMIGLYVFLAVVVALQFYHFIQYMRKKSDMLVRGYIVETHLNKGIAFSMVSIVVIFIIGVLFALTH